METLIGSAIDIVIGLIALGLAWGALSSAKLFKAIVLFIAFGLMMALAWVRLNAPDVALAEAAIGAGLTGALLLTAYKNLHASTSVTNLESIELGNRFSSVRTLASLAIAVLVATGLGYAVWMLPPEAAGLSISVAADLGNSGVTNPVTAVLLNFRGYDTLLELFVLLLALLGVWSLGLPLPRQETAPGLVLDTLSRLLVPLLIMVAAYLLWVGAYGPGGAFQAGAVLAAAGVLMLLSGSRLPDAWVGWPLRLLLVLGPATFLLLGIITGLLEGRFLQLPIEWAGVLILVIETAATLSIAAALIALFMGTRPSKEKW
ncbi:hydrogenase subunit MbhD domain-containing protein [Psychrobacter sp. 72-O-c]|uniref:hydrogenase subunit MbhD domain-containing protein n=1 Tax=Psychrobacter sp. 72-O-c TaxID=2774125 RepID=UPI0019181142|nr:hydrogenase subunit MbhD domain-containing protein [Psychrobacter sp. 72-O-c]